MVQQQLDGDDEPHEVLGDEVLDDGGLGDEALHDEAPDDVGLGDDHDDPACDGAEQLEQCVHDHAPGDAPCGQHDVCHDQPHHDSHDGWGWRLSHGGHCWGQGWDQHEPGEGGQCPVGGTRATEHVGECHVEVGGHELGPVWRHQLQHPSSPPHHLPSGPLLSLSQ